MPPIKKLSFINKFPVSWSVCTEIVLLIVNDKCKKQGDIIIQITTLDWWVILGFYILLAQRLWKC
ncbi:hypothetical protein VHARVF571_310021 [Vibrio harveyi]|nr:hypothetical protein VHARVF571_310021 [Vibrio harveyi]